MPALDHSWIMLTGLSIASALCGYGLRHLLCVQADRASAIRIATLCDQLDLKDGTLQALRAELLAAQAQGRELRSALAASPAAGTSKDSAARPFGLGSIRVNHDVQVDPAPCTEGGGATTVFKPPGRVCAAEPAATQRTG